MRRFLVFAVAVTCLVEVGCKQNVNPQATAPDKPIMMPPPGGPKAAGKAGAGKTPGPAAPSATDTP